MKQILYLLLLCPFLSFAQEIPKRSTGIIVNTHAPDSALFERAVMLFDTSGYMVMRADDKRGVIITDKQLVSGVMSMRILANIHKGIISIKGQWFSNYHDYITYVKDNVAVRYTPAGGNEKACFMVLVSMAKQLQSDFPGSNLEYMPAAEKK